MSFPEAQKRIPMRFRDATEQVLAKRSVISSIASRLPDLFANSIA